MKRKISALAAALCILAAASLASCKNPDIYVDPAGNTYVAVTNEEGNTVLNDEGNIVVYQTEENGEVLTDESGVPQTQASIFPDAIVDGDEIQTLTYNIALPTGWKASNDSGGSFEKRGSSATMSIRVVNYSFDDYYVKTQTDVEALKTAVEEAGGTCEYEFSEFEYLAAKVTATKVRYTTVLNEESSTAEFIIFECYGNVYAIDCRADTSEFDSVNFPELYSAITFKPYTYY